MPELLRILGYYIGIATVIGFVYWGWVLSIHWVYNCILVDVFGAPKLTKWQILGGLIVLTIIGAILKWLT